MSHKSSGRRTPQAIKLVDGELGILLRRICFLHCHLPAHGLGTRRAPRRKKHMRTILIFFTTHIVRVYKDTSLLRTVLVLGPEPLPGIVRN